MTGICVKTVIIKEENGWYSLLVNSEQGKECIYRELTRDLVAICELSEKINRGNLSPIHIEDVIEDFLS